MSTPSVVQPATFMIPISFVLYAKTPLVTQIVDTANALDKYFLEAQEGWRSKFQDSVGINTNTGNILKQRNFT
jgi:hypothetical protein